MKQLLICLLLFVFNSIHASRIEPMLRNANRSSIPELSLSKFIPIYQENKSQVWAESDMLTTSSERDFILNYINDFPFVEYKAKYVPNLGYFYIDGINDCIKNELRKGMIWEPHIGALISRYAAKGTVAIDIGAHIGSHAITMSKAVGAEGRVIVFEPQPKIFRELFMNISLNNLSNVTFFWAGIGNAIGKIELPPLIKFNEAGTGLYGGGTNRFVNLMTLDSLNLSNVSFIKIDVEGMEDLVLDGAVETILTNKPVIIIEIMGGSCWSKCSPEIREKIMFTINKLQSLGYAVERIPSSSHLSGYDDGWDYIATPQS